MDITPITDILVLVLAAVGTMKAAEIVIPATVKGWKMLMGALGR